MQSSKELPIEEQLSQVTADMSVSGDSCLEVYTVGSTAPFSLDELVSICVVTYGLFVQQFLC